MPHCRVAMSHTFCFFATTKHISPLRICCVPQACRKRSTLPQEPEQGSPWDRYAGLSEAGHVVMKIGTAAVRTQVSDCVQPGKAGTATGTL